MRRFFRFLLVLLLILTVLLAGLLIWQRDNVSAVFRWLVQDSQTISKNMEQTMLAHHRQLQAIAHITVDSLTAEQSDALLDGSRSADEIKSELGVNEALKLPEQPTYDDLVNACTAELYAYKAELMEQLGQMKEAAQAEWNALPDEQHTKAKKDQIVNAGMKQCLELEKVADHRVLEVLDDYRGRLQQINADTTVMDELWKYYCDEKKTEKAYYMDKYL